MSLVRTGRVLVVLLVAVGAAGCAGMNKVEEPIVVAASLEEAKAESLAVQDQIVAFVPKGQVVKTNRSEKRSLLNCGDGMYSWPGGTTLFLEGEIDRHGVLDQVAKKFEAAPEWTVSRYESAGEPNLELRRDDDLGMIVGFLPPNDTFDGYRFDIDGFSACFPFEPELGEDY